MHRLFLAGLFTVACGGKSSSLPIGGSLTASDTGEAGTTAEDGASRELWPGEG